MDFDKRYLKNLDWTLVLVLMMFAVYSYLGISVTPYGMKFGLDEKQLVWYLLGFVGLGMIIWFDYKYLSQFSYILYVIGIIMLVLVLFTEPTRGVHGWFTIGSIKIQPAEFAKLFTIMAISKFLAKRDEEGLVFEKWWQLLPIMGFVFLPFALIFIQPDLGNALVLIGILMSMLVAGGVPFRYFMYMGASVGLLFGFFAFLFNFKQQLFFKIIHGYQWERIESWLHPELYQRDQGWQLLQSLIAVGSGRLTGRSSSEFTQAQNGWIPVGESDFIFSVIAEQFGFLGASLLIFLFFYMNYRMVRIAMEAKDAYGSYFVSGVIGMFVFQVFENIGMTIQLMPITGITLPFISYGGSSLLTNMLIVGLVLNIGMRRKTLMFD